MTLALAFVVGYLLGSIPFGPLLTRAAGGPDLRTIGSGNIGATNVLRTGNKALAAATLLGDMLKGTAAVLLAQHFAGTDAALAAALGAFLGHLFPVWLKFKGGKGVATYIGLLLGLYWPGAIDLLRGLALGRRRHPLFLPRRARRQRADATRALAARPAAHGRAAGDPQPSPLAAAPAQYPPAHRRQRGQDRGEERVIRACQECVVRGSPRFTPPTCSDPPAYSPLSPWPHAAVQTCTVR